jgi:hypothetical protein
VRSHVRNGRSDPSGHVGEAIPATVLGQDEIAVGQKPEPGMEVLVEEQPESVDGRDLRVQGSVLDVGQAVGR